MDFQSRFLEDAGVTSFDRLQEVDRRSHRSIFTSAVGSGSVGIGLFSSNEVSQFVWLFDEIDTLRNENVLSRCVEPAPGAVVQI